MKYIESRILASAIFILSMLLPSVVWAESEYQLTVVANPTMAGTFNKSSATLYAGVTIQLVAYSNTNFTFIQWTDESGAVISKQMKLDFVMPDHDCQLTAEYEYNPANPANPVQNYWNKLLGEVIVDDFTTGSLQNAVKNVIYDSKAADVMMITVAGIMNANDFGIINTYSSCTLLDFSRVTGVTQVPSYAFDNTKLEAVYLPATIESIGTQAFYGCQQLSSMIIYATMPPSLGSNVFTNVPEGLVVYVPATAIAQYQNAAGWKDFNILPIQEDIRSISVSLPNGTNIQDYAQMWLELTNTKNGQRIHYVMTDRTQYTFPNIIRNTSWNVVLRNERGDVFGQIDNVEVKDDDVTVTFASLSKPQNVSLSVLTPDGKNVTEQVRVTWTDVSGNYLAQSASLSGLPVGYQANYRVVLSQELAMMYNTPQIIKYTLKDGDNNITCQLETIKQVQLTGKVKDETTGLPLSGAVISASQTFGGKYSKTQNTKTDKDGVFTITVSDVPTTLAFAASDYVSQTIVCDSLMKGDATVTLPDVSLRSITGATITIGFTYSPVDGETQNWYSDYQNVSYTLYNITQEKPISQFNVQYPQIVLLEEVNDGDVLKLTASSRTNAFKAVETTTTIAEQKANATFAIIELGQIQASFERNGNASVVGSLYDASGKLVKTYNYTNASLTVSNLADGQYTLVSMGNSRLFNTIYDLAQLPQTGLIEGSDYVMNSVEVKSGAVSKINIDEVPTLDESKLYYTGDNTSFTVNKPSIVAGNYLTLTGHIDFKLAYATSVNNVQMIVDLPESCQFVENSVMVGNSTSSYLLNGNQITIPMTRYTDRVRFCVIPTLGGEYAPSAFVQFDIDGETVTQPIGSAYYTAKDLSINVPAETSDPSILISGAAKALSTVSIYDNSVLIGITTVPANGKWSVTCSLFKPYSHSYHSIHAEIETKDNHRLRTISQTVEFDKARPKLLSISMLYNGNTIVFDMNEGKSNRNTYSYVPSRHDFTFVAKFDKNDTTLIKNVVFEILASDKTSRFIDGIYDEKQNVWVGYSKYPNSYKIPINVKASYTCSVVSPIWDDEQNQDYFYEYNFMINKIDEAYKDCKIEIMSEEDSICNFSAITNIYGVRENYTFELLNYRNVVNTHKDKDYFEFVNDTIDICIADFESGNVCGIIIWDKNQENAWSIGKNVFSHNNRRYVLPLIISYAGGIAIPIIEYVVKDGVNKNWDRTINCEIERWNEKYSTLLNLVNARCKDGTYRIKDEGKRNNLYAAINGWRDNVNKYFDYLINLVQLERYALYKSSLYKVDLNILTSASFGLLGGKLENLFKGDSNLNIVKGFYAYWSERNGQIISYVGGEVLSDNIENKISISDSYVSETNAITNDWTTLIKLIRSNTSNCEIVDDIKESEFPISPLSPSIDPSGYIYEGVSSNRLEGVTATAYYKEMVEDMYGDLHENVVKWDASEYAQENPLFTDENGFYQWDVPQGLWQVKFEKEGYETTYSEWLPVPPPQLDVNIAMKQNRQPEVKAARAYESAVEVEFDKYMMPELLTTDNIIVMQGNEAVAGSVELLNNEASYEGSSESFVSKIRFNAAQPFTVQEITLMVSNRVKSYAGIRMQDDFLQTFKVEQEIKQIVCDSMAVVDYGGKSTLTVSVIPASASKGKTLTVKTSSPMILGVENEQVIIGEDGKAEITVSGELPGTAALTFSVEGTDKTALTIASVEKKIYTFVAIPIANIASGSVVDTGTQIILSCETDGVTIYYTIDGSCPCDNASRIKYDGTPIIINEGVTIKIIAVAPNGIESEVAEYVYTTKDEEDAVIEVPTTTTNTKDEYDISGRKVVRKTKGIIIRNNNGTNRKVLVK